MLKRAIGKDTLFDLAIAILVIAGLVLAFRFFSITEVRGWVEGAGVWAPVALIVAKATTLVVAPLGGSPLYPIAGALFGFWKGVLYLVIGDVIGGTISFYLSRFLGKRVVDYFFRREQSLVKRVLVMLGTIKGLLTARILFVTYPELVSYTAGLTKISFLPFILIYAGVGLVPTTVMVALGTLLTEANSPGIFGLLLAAGAVLMVAGVFIFWKLLPPAAPEEGGEAVAEQKNPT